MKKLHPLLSVLFLTSWGCEGILNSYDEHFGSTVNLWGEEYSVKNTIELNLTNTGLTGSIPSKIGDLKNLERIYLSRNQLSGEIPPEIGNLLNENWKLKKRLSEKVSNYKIDEIYNEAINSGASGGKLLGAGGGGFMLFYCKKNKQKNLKKRLNKFTSLNFEFINSGSEIIENEI